VGPWTPLLLTAAGISSTAGSAVRFADGFALTPGRDGSGVRVVHAAAQAARQVEAREQARRRELELRSAIASGRVGVDVLARPLFPYQRDGVGLLVSAGRALLADDMGLGKTVQAIAACEVLRARGEARRVIVVTPASLKHQWAREIEAYAGERPAVLAGGSRVRAEALASDPTYLVLSYEMTWRELHRLRALEADVLVLDEAQRARNFRTKTATTLKAIPSRFAFVLTGTPVENRLDDLYSLMQLVDPTLLGPLWRFNLDFHRQNEKGRVVGYKDLARLRERIGPVVLRRRKEEVLSQLPALTQQTRYTRLTAEQEELESAHRKTAASYLAKAEKRPLTPQEQKYLQAALLKARQACNAVELCDPLMGVTASPKLDELEAILAEIVAQGTAKVLVFSEWVEMLRLAAARLDRLGIGYAMLHGGVPSAHRPALLDRFREDPDQRVLLASEAGGVGLNLQVASYVVHLDLPWNPARLDQRVSRAHRLGQTRGVSVISLCAESGIERGIEHTLAGKRSLRSAALDPDSGLDRLDLSSFTAFARELGEVIQATETDLGAPAATVPPAAAIEAPPASVEPAPLAAGPPPPAAAERPAAAEPSTRPADEPARASRPSRAAGRLRLARVVLDAGFPADAVQAAYQALAAAIRALLETDPGPAHAALVAAVYRELLPKGRLAPAAPAVLARLHDLTSLEEHGVEVDPDLARDAVAEAEGWVERLAG
jgi:superfamily II DNA or RNA helicase